MATDYDAPRKEEENVDSIEELKTANVPDAVSSANIDEIDAADSFDLPGADLSGEELAVRVVPAQEDEFVCSVCFLVHHKSQIAHVHKNGDKMCTECEEDQKASA